MRAVLLALAVGAALVAATHASARQVCTPGGTPSTRTYCGPAEATLKDRGTTYHFRSGGNCTHDASTWSLNVGTIAITGTPKKKYLGITVFSRKAGTHDAAVSWQLPGRKTQSLSHAKVTLARGRLRGTFRGTHGGVTSTGSFTCK